MKAIVKTLGVFILALSFITVNAQRKLTGVVYMNGEPAGGIIVTAHKAKGEVWTGFDGKYELDGSEKSKYIKFSYGGETKKLDIEGKEGSVFDFSWDGIEIPSADEKGLNMKSHEELMSDGESEYISNSSLYAEYYGQKDYKSALPYWRKVYNGFPKSTKNIYIHGFTIFESFLNDTDDNELKKQYIDSLMSVMDRRIKFMNNEGEVVGKKAINYIKYSLPLVEDDTERAEVGKTTFDFATKSYELLGDKVEIPTLLILMKTTKMLYNLDEIDGEVVIDNYEKIMSTIDAKEATGESEAMIADARASIEKDFETSGAANCDALIKIYTAKFENDKTNIELIRKILRALRKNDCTDSELFNITSEKLYELEPSAEAAFNMYRMFMRQEDIGKAQGYIDQAIEKESDPDLKSEYLYNSAFMAFGHQNLKKARMLAKRALRENPSYCKANVLLGDIYAMAAKDYTKDDFKNQCVYWLAVDYFEKAARNGDCAKEAKDKITIYSRYFPGQETIFFQDLKEGATYLISGWIDEGTKVRAKK